MEVYSHSHSSCMGLRLLILGSCCLHASCTFIGGLHWLISCLHGCGRWRQLDPELWNILLLQCILVQVEAVIGQLADGLQLQLCMPCSHDTSQKKAESGRVQLCCLPP